MNKSSFSRTSFFLLSGLLVSLASLNVAQAEDFKPDAFFGELGGAQQDSYTASAGLIWKFPFRRQWLGGQVTAHAEALATYWNARNELDDGRSSFGLVAVVPMLRYRFSGGDSAWFAEAGIGASVTNRVVRTSNKEFSTAFNFYDALAVGRNFGADRRQEASVRLIHVSNAGIKNPNPGENFLQLRYTFAF